jgi:hypothetical protein
VSVSFQESAPAADVPAESATEEAKAVRLLLYFIKIILDSNILQESPKKEDRPKSPSRFAKLFAPFKDTVSKVKAKGPKSPKKEKKKELKEEVSI